MENKRHWINYDWFKLFAALIFLILFLVLLVTNRPTPPIAVASLPENPAAGFTWNYNPAGQTLMDPQGVEHYKLSPDQKTWQPIIPAEIQGDLPSGYQLTLETAGGWALKAPDGSLLYTWVIDSLQWVPVHAAAVSSPQLAASSTPAPTEAPAAAPAALATVVPTLAPAAVSTAASTAEPISTAAAPSTLAVTPATGAPAVTDVPGCQPPVASRLVIGKNARILSNLNQRSEPGLGDNILTVNPAGDVLKLLDGPVCLPFLDSAYLWWQVENPKGITGWSAENLLSGGGYFLSPLP